MAYRLQPRSQESRTSHPKIDHGYYINIHNTIRPTGWIDAGLLSFTVGQHSYDCRCHTFYDWNKDCSLLQYKMFKFAADLQQVIRNMRINGKNSRAQIASSSILRELSWLENTNSILLTPTNTTIHGVSGNVKASMQNNWKFTHSNLPRYDRQCFVSRVVSSK